MEQRGPTALPRHHADMDTRQLCGWAYRDLDRATHWIDVFATEKFRAHGLPLGIDLVAVVRHARRAKRLFLLRDTMLAICLATLVAGVVGSVAAFVVEDFERLGTWLRVILYTLLASVLLVYAWGWVLWRRAQAVHWGDAAPREGAAPVNARLEAELDALDKTNVVPYTMTGRDGEQPFVGSGFDVLETVWAGIDVSRPAEDDEGAELTVEPFDAVALHSYVTEHVGDLAGLDGLRVRDRLYVRGNHVRDLGSVLLPDPQRRPLTWIDPALVEEGIAETGGIMRTYLSLELTGPSGSYVATVYVRARLFRSRLSWEVSAYYLPPLYSALGHHDTDPFGFIEQAWKLLGFTRRELRRQLFRSWRRMAGRLVRVGANHWRVWRSRRKITLRRGLFDYGTLTTLRAEMSDPDRLVDYTQRMDAIDAFQRLQQAVLLATEQFLKDHNVDTSDLKEAHKTVNNQTYNFSGDINGGQHIFGNRGTSVSGGDRSRSGTDGGRTAGGTGTGTGANGSGSRGAAAPSRNTSGGKR